MKLADREWKPFFLSSIFPKPKRGKRIINENHVEGNKPLVSSMGINNGVTNFIGNTEKVRIYDNCLSIANGGSSAGKCFYEPFEFIASDHVTHCKNVKLTKNQYLALAALISGKLQEKYNFCREITDQRISREKIMLPVGADGEPDFVFLEKYVEELKTAQLKKYTEYAKKTANKLRIKKIPDLKDKEWKPFFIAGENGIFDLTATASGIDKNKLNMEEGNIPYVTRTNETNGVNLFVSDKQDSKWGIDEGNVITIGLDTQTVFYQPHKFLTGQNIQVLKRKNMSRQLAMFLVSMLNMQVKKFNWGGNGATLGRLYRNRIMLPINNEGEPDFEYMEQYIENLMVKKYQAYIDYIER